MHLPALTTLKLLLLLCPAGTAPADLELQPNAGAPLLRTEKARREWVEQELELCSTSWQYQKVRVASSLALTQGITPAAILLAPTVRWYICFSPVPLH
jgi:hypothetical protein